jgi:cAMP-specific phosphodiesterase 4
MQAGAIYGASCNLETLTRMSHARWGIVAFSLSGNIILWVALGVCCFSTRQLEEKFVQGKLQILLFILGIIVVLIVLAHPVYLNGLKASKDESIDNTVVVLLLSYHQLTKMCLFLLMTLSMISTIWNMQFLPFCALGSFSTVVTWIWFLYENNGSYFIEEWHVPILFPFVIGILARGLYRNEYHLRLKFIRLRHLMLENIKLTQQNQYMKCQLSSQIQMDSSMSNNNLNTNNLYTGSNNIYGESSMEGVLKTLCALKKKLHTEAKTTKELDFVIQTLISDQDLFGMKSLPIGGVAQMRENSSSSLRNIGMEIIGPDEDLYGWLSLVGRQRRRKTTSINTSTKSNTTISPMVVKTIRRTVSGLKQTILKQIDHYFIQPSPNLFPNDFVYREENKKKEIIVVVWNASFLLECAGQSLDLNFFNFSKICMFPLTAILLTTMESHHLFTELPLSLETTCEFCLEIESRYQSKNPYHNAIHAASVLWDVNFFLRKLKAKELNSLQIFSALIAAAIHDVNHPGLSNTYLINTNAPLAIKYSDDSCLERMHLAEGFQACTKEGCDLFEEMNNEMKRQARQIIITMVLATDLSKHMKHVNKLKSTRYATRNTTTTNTTTTNTTTTSITIEQEQCPTTCRSSSSSSILPNDDLILQSILMMSDIGHANKSFAYHYEWSKLVTEEFHLQGDREKQFGLEISPLCDRTNTKFEKNQIGFFEFVVFPLYNAVNEVIFFQDFEQILQSIKKNTFLWKERAKQREKGQVISPPPCIDRNTDTLMQGSMNTIKTSRSSATTVVEETAEELKELDHLEIEIH